MNHPQSIFRSFSLILLTLGLCVFPADMLAQVIGHAFLQGETDHSGILVEFLPQSISGQADTAYTDQAGQYSLTVVPGVYEINFTKTGFNPRSYQGGTGQLLTNNDTLEDVTLPWMLEKNIAGIIQDTLYEDTVYVVQGDLTVNAGSHLYLQAGTHLLFAGNYSLTCQGDFTAKGTPNKPVTISSYQTNPASEDWGGIHLAGGTDTAVIEYALVEYGDMALEVNGPPVLRVSNSLFRHNRMAIHLYGTTSAIITDNEFADQTDNCIFGRQWLETSLLVSCNYFHDGTGAGVQTSYSEADVTITNNLFDNIQDVYEGPIAIWSTVGENLIEDNLILNSTSGIRILLDDSLQTGVAIRHNLIAGNINGISLRAAAGGAIISMNTVVNNSNAGILQFFPSGGNPQEVSYNLVANNGTDYTLYQIVGAGIPITTNANGTPCDAYYNISDATGFDYTQTLYPLPGTPLVDAGDPLAAPDPDGTPPDIGARFDPGCPLWFAQTNSVTAVLPGDTDNDGLANAWDLLAVGSFYGISGPARPNASNSWIPQPALDWGLIQPGGADLKHVDCNGDGVINAADSAAILTNYQTIPTGSPASGGSGAPMYFSMPTQAANPGDTIAIPVMLGVVDTPALGIYGMALSITYDTMMVVPGSVKLDFSDSWVGEEDSTLLAIQKDQFEAGKIDLAFTRIDQQNVDGYGKIADLIIVIDEDISKRFVPIHFDFVDMVSQGHNGAPVALGARAGVLSGEVESDSVSTSLNDQAVLAPEVYPIPANQTLSVELDPAQAAVRQVHLYRIDGVEVWSESGINKHQFQLSVADFPNGMYILHVQTRDGQFYRNVQIAH